ncbi:MAG: flippase-like domain-containing protein [Candidatus Micrarchaeota archaeon]|nr:flippase-like domain-containing protein [Candidatus Micrarchaeota archaeon]
MEKSLLGFSIHLVLSIIVIILMSYIIGVEKIIASLTIINPVLFSLAILSYVMVNIVMAMRIRYVLEKLNERISFREAFMSNMFGMLLSDITIARSGYFGTAFDISVKTGIPLEKSLVSIFLPQMIDFIIKVLSSILLINLIVINLGILDSDQVLVFTIICTLFLLLFFGIIYFLVEKDVIEKLSFLSSLKIFNKVYFLLRLVNSNSSLLKQYLLKILTFTLVAWIFKGLEWYFLALAFDINIYGIYDPIFFLLFQPLVTFSHFLPIPTIGGTGLSEGITSLILVGLGIDIVVAFSYGFMTRFLMLIVNGIFGINRLYEIVSKGEFTKLLTSINDMLKRSTAIST